MLESRLTHGAAWLALLSASLLGGCSSQPPRQQEDLCLIFAEKPAWHAAAENVSKRWGTPAFWPMAVVHH